MADQKSGGGGRKGRGFRRTGALLSGKIREVGEARGFAVSRVLTHWSEIVGSELAAQARPVEVSYGRGGIGATLSVLTTGALAPMVEMQKERIRERVNACYGYNAISRVRVTQSAATGFADGRVAFAPKPAKPAPGPAPSACREAQILAAGVRDEALRLALADLGANILSKSDKLKGNA